MTRHLLLACVLAITAMALVPVQAPADVRRQARVDYAVDGDTIRLANGEYVRLIGIDTPEVYGQSECGGHKASRALEKMLHHGNRVTLIRDPKVDNHDFYGRQLRYVEKAGKDLGQHQVNRGWAKVHVFERPAFRRVEKYRAAQRRAKDHNHGVWRHCSHF